MTEEQLKNGVLSALIEFQDHQLDNFASNIEKVVPSVMKVVEDMCNMVEEKAENMSEKAES